MDNTNTSLEKLLSDIRHDLRNEVAIVREALSLTFDTMEDIPADKLEPLRKILRMGIERSDKLNRMIGELLTVAKIAEAKEKGDSHEKNTGS